MIPCPVSGTLGIDYKVSQWFGQNVQYYRKYNLQKGHNGIDLAIPVGTPLYAPFDGYISYGDEGKSGYGKYVTLVSDPMGPAQTRRRMDLGHLSRFANFKQGQYVLCGTLIGISGNTGDSTGPHVHLTYKTLNTAGDTMNKDNGSNGALDISEFILLIDIKKVLNPKQ